MLCIVKSQVNEGHSQSIGESEKDGVLFGDQPGRRLGEQTVVPGTAEVISGDLSLCFPLVGSLFWLVDLLLMHNP